MKEKSTLNHRTESVVDIALRSYMIKVYNYMGFALLLTALTAFLSASSPEVVRIIQTQPYSTILMLSPLAFILVLSFGINKLQPQTAQIIFWVFAAVNGVAFSTLFQIYTGTSITKVFLITAATFLAMSLYGYTTKADLSKFGTILLMALIGIVIASIVNIFTKSSALDLIISIVGVIVFTGLTAWDTQKIKASFDDSLSNDQLSKFAIMGALSLYMDFINLFLMLLRLIGDRRD